MDQQKVVITLHTEISLKAGQYVLGCVINATALDFAIRRNTQPKENEAKKRGREKEF